MFSLVASWGFTRDIWSWKDMLWFGNALVVLAEHVPTKVYGIQAEPQGDTI